MALSRATYAAPFTSLGLASTNPGSRDQIRNEDLQWFYQYINRASFDGNLPDVPVRWGDLTEADAYGITRFDHGVPYAMVLDRETVRSASFALDVIRHESCHIATNREAKRRGEAPHGATFVACMARIQEDGAGD